MPVCFELIDRSTGEIVPPVEVDNRMRAALGYEPDATNWLANWYNCFGMMLACGNSWEEIKWAWDEQPAALVVADYLAVLSVAEYLASIYDIRCWRE